MNWTYKLIDSLLLESFLYIYTGFPKMVVPPKHPKWSFLVGTPMVVGYHHLRKPLYTYIYILSQASWWWFPVLPVLFFKCLYKTSTELAKIQLIHMTQAEDLPRPLTQPDMAEVDVPWRFVCFLVCFCFFFCEVGEELFLTFNFNVLNFNKNFSVWYCRLKALPNCQGWDFNPPKVGPGRSLEVLAGKRKDHYTVYVYECIWALYELYEDDSHFSRVTKVVS